MAQLQETFVEGNVTATGQFIETGSIGAPSQGIDTRYTQTYTIPGEVLETGSGGDGYIPPFFEAVGSGEDKVIKSVRHVLRTGNCDVTVLRNESVISGYDNISVSDTAGNETGPEISLADGDLLRLRVDAVSNNPEDLTVSIVVETKGV